ncbi:DUF2000 domain-containing protein [Gracilibacillus phocaeensis]|nr:DUF2000 domain-containing protein [Gracilibacillus phocaeensis]
MKKMKTVLVMDGNLPLGLIVNTAAILDAPEIVS